MKNKQRKGFTIVELVIVIAVIAILAAVLIPTFSSIIKKANQSAYLQEKTNQQIADLAEKVDNIDLVTWDDVEEDVIEKVGEAVKANGGSVTNNYTTKEEYITQTPEGTVTEAQIKEIVVAAVNSAAGSQLTEAQVKKIVENAVKNIEVSESSTTNNTTQIIEQYYDDNLDVITQMNYAVYNAVHYNGATVNTCYDALVASSKAGLGNTEAGLVLQDLLKVAFDTESKKFYAIDATKNSGENKIVEKLANESDADFGIRVAAKNTKIVVLETTNGDSDKAANLTSNIYGTYLLAGSSATTITTNKSFDAGECELDSVTYANTGSAQNIVIRTNGGTLTVDAQNDTVAHYGIADKVVVTAVANSSYDEYGTVKGNIEIAKGHVVVKEGAEVESVIAKAITASIKIENKTTDVKVKDGVELPQSAVEGAEVTTAKYVSTFADLEIATGEVYLDNDITFNGSLTIEDGKQLIINLNGNNILAKNNYIMLYNGTLNFVGNGSVNGDANLFQVYGSTEDVSNFTNLKIGKNVLLNVSSNKAICIYGARNANKVRDYTIAYGINVLIEGTVKCDDGAIYVYGVITTTNGNYLPKIVLDGANIICNTRGMYLAGYAKTIITNTTFTKASDNTIDIAAGELIIESGTFDSSTSSGKTESINGSITTTCGNCVYIKQHTTLLPIIVDIKGGTFTGGACVKEEINTSASSPKPELIEIKISGGTFTSLNNGNAVSKQSDAASLTITGGTYFENGNDVTSNYVTNN